MSIITITSKQSTDQRWALKRLRPAYSVCSSWWFAQIQTPIISILLWDVMGLWEWEEKQEYASQCGAPRWIFIPILSLQVILCPLRAGNVKGTHEKRRIISWCWSHYCYVVVLIISLYASCFVNERRCQIHAVTSFGIIKYYLICWRQIYSPFSARKYAQIKWFTAERSRNSIRWKSGESLATGSTPEQQVWDCVIKAVIKPNS